MDNNEDYIVDINNVEEIKTLEDSCSERKKTEVRFTWKRLQHLQEVKVLIAAYNSGESVLIKLPNREIKRWYVSDCRYNVFSSPVKTSEGMGDMIALQLVLLEVTDAR